MSMFLVPMCDWAAKSIWMSDSVGARIAGVLDMVAVDMECG